jgi:hypothetical protein
LDLRAQEHADLHTWDVSRECYAALIKDIRFARESAAGERQTAPGPDGQGVLTLQPSRRS